MKFPLPDFGRLHRETRNLLLICGVASAPGRVDLSLGHRRLNANYMSVLDQGTSDDRFHDLVRSTVDALYAGVFIHPADQIFAHVAIAAMELHTSIDNLAMAIGKPVFGHRRSRGLKLATEVLFDAVVVEHLTSMRDGVAFGQFEGGVLELEHTLSEGSSLVGVADGVLDCAAHRPNRLRGDYQALLCELCHQLAESTAFLRAEQILDRYANVGERQL